MKFELDKDEVARCDEWIKTHLAEKHPTPKSQYAGAIGGLLSWTFTPTSLGVISSVRCGKCGESCVLTDFESW